MADEQSARRAPRAASCPSRPRLPDSSGFSPGARQHADAARPRDFPHGSKHRSGGRSGRVVKGLARSLASAANAAASASPASGRDRTARRATWLVTAFGAFLLAMVPVPSQAQEIPVPKVQTHQLASNLAQTSASTGNALKDYAYAQAFTTGSQQFLLNNIRVDFTAAGKAREQVYAYLYSATSSGRPGIGLAMLAIGGGSGIIATTPAVGVNKFEPMGATLHSRMSQRILEPNTTYFVVVTSLSTTSTASVALTDSNGEDSGSVSGSSIADGGYRRATGTSTWTATGSALKIKVSGERFVSVSNAVAREGFIGDAGDLKFRVTVSPPLASGTSAELRYVTQGITARQEVDFDGKSGTLNYSAGQSSKTVTVNTIDDRVEDDGETMELVINYMYLQDGSKDYVLAKIRNGIGTIRNSEADPPAEASVLSVADAEATEGRDATMDFVVTLDPAETVRVTVDYRTTNIGFEYTAESSSDYTSTNGTLRFEPGEITKTVSVPILADEVEDDGETFLLYLTNPVSAQNGGGGVGTIRDASANTPAAGAPTVSGTAQVGETLTAATSAITDADGLDDVTYSYQWIVNDGNADADIEGATGTTYAPVNVDVGKTIKVRVTFTDDGGTQETLTSAATVAVAAAPNTAPTGLPSISGTAQVGETLTAVTSAISDADGLDDVTYSYQWIVNDGRDDTEIAGATSKTYTVAPDDAGTTLKVRVTFTDGGGTEEVLTSAATEAVPVPLTAQFRGVPESHDGTSEFSFEVLFSEPVRVSYLVLKNHSFNVTGGTVEKARRARDENGVVRHDLREIHIEPNTQGDVTVVLAGGRACGTQGAICTADEKVLSGTLRLTVPGPASAALPAVSVAGGASPVTEGAGVAFTLTRTGDVSAALTVAVEVTETGAMLAGDAPTEVTFEAASATAALTLATVDDEAAEAASVLAVTVASGDGYTVASEGTSAEVTVEDDDAAPEVTSALALAVPENATAVATLEATDTDTDGEDLAWSIAGGADAGAFALTEAGVLTFKASKDFEAPDDADGDGTYEVTVRVTDGANPVDAALKVSLTDADEVAPVLTGTAVNGTALTLTYGEALDEDSSPGAGAFAVTVAEAARTVDAVTVSGSAVTLTLASAVASGETVTVGYTAPTGANAAPLKDASGNEAASFTGQAVTNDTPAPENTAPTGLPSISGTPQVGVELTASASAIEDGDGTENATFKWQWLVNNGAEDTEIAGATSAGYTPKPGDVGKVLKVRVTFTDDKGTEETLTSAATAAVAATVPDAPGNATAATADGREQELTVSWTAPESDGGAAISGYRVQWKSGSESYDGSETSTRQAVVTGLTHTIAGLTNGVTYTVRIVAVNEAGDGEAVEVSAESRDRVAPVLSKAVVDGTSLTLTYSEALDEDSSPDAGAFAVTVAESARTVDTVDVSGNAAVLTLASAVASGETVTVGYTVPTGSDAALLKDTAGNAVGSFSGESVTNDTPAAQNSSPTGLPEISGTPQVGVELTASALAIEDGDGTENAAFEWQWLSNDGTEGAEDIEIADATAAGYTPKPGDVGRTLKVRVTFTDDKGTEEMLTSEATAAVAAAPVEVSIAAASTPVTEGSDAVFTLTRTGATTAALTVGVSVSISGAFLDGSAPSEVAFVANAATATLRVATANDETSEADGRISASIASGAGYAVASGAGSAGVDVFDNDKAAPTETVLWSATMTVVDYETGAIGAGSADLLTNIGGSEDLGARSLWYWAPGRKLHLKFSEAIPEGDGLTLHIGSRALALPAGSAGNPGTAWEGIDIAWNDGETIEVRLTMPVAEDTTAAPGLSVADARVREAAGAELAFQVTLDAAQSSVVSVRYATSDGTAVAGSDYVAARGAVRFAPGQTSKTVRVLVLEDAHDDNGETLTLTLSSPFGAQLADGQATGTIENTDPLPQAWLARFGRTVAGHVVDAISARFEGSAGGGSHVTLGGQRLSLYGDGGSGPEGAAVETSESEAAARDGLAALAERIGSGTDEGAWTSWEESGSGDGWMREGAGDGAWSMTGRELLLGSSFHLALGEGEDGASAADTRWTAWGRASSSHFDGETDGLSVDGEVTTFTLGGDAAWGRWLGGVAVSLSEGEGGFSDHDESRGAGALESSLTSVHPYLRYEASERLSVWGILGYGTGELTLKVDDKETWTTDTTMEMAAAGARSVLLSAAESGGVELAVRTDAQLVRMTSDAATGSEGGNLAATEGDTSRVRVMLEGSRAFELEGGGALTPSLELGLRHDGGDAETGTGIEVGGGLSYTDPASGITVDARVRGLAAHEDTDYSEWGASGSVRIEPDASGRGLSLSIAPSWGVDSGGAEQLWSAGDARGLAPEGTVDQGSRLEAELGYGFTVLDGLGVLTPYGGWSRSGESEALRLGQWLSLGPSVWRLESEFGEANRAFRVGYGYRLRDFLDLNVVASRREAANDNPGEHEIGFRLTARW